MACCRYLPQPQGNVFHTPKYKMYQSRLTRVQRGEKIETDRTSSRRRRKVEPGGRTSSLHSKSSSRTLGHHVSVGTWESGGWGGWRTYTHIHTRQPSPLGYMTAMMLATPFCVQGQLVVVALARMSDECPQRSLLNVNRTRTTGLMWQQTAEGGR